MPEARELQVQDDESDFYGRRYYDSYLTGEHGLPSLEDRSRNDLPERCAHWLNALLRYKAPPAKTLEIGCAHGAFVALQGWAGFDATGLEVSPSLVEYAKGTFGVRMFKGPVEGQTLEPGSLDAIFLMDVVEHLPDPEVTLRHCLKLLKQNGVLFVQTPRYPEGKSLEELEHTNDRFLEHLKPVEHLYLFSESSISRLLAGLGAGHIQFEPAIFAHYDMFLAASVSPVSVRTGEEIQAGLAATPGGRLVRALLDVSAQFRDLTGRYREAEADRGARLEIIHKAEERIAGLESVRSALLEQAGVEREEHARAVSRLEDQLDGLREEVAAGATERRELLGRLKTLEDGHVTLEARERELSKRLAEAEAERGALLRSARARERKLAETEAKRRGAEGRLTEAAPVLERLPKSTIVRLLRAVGLWRWTEVSPGLSAPRLPAARRWTKLKRVCVDLTPLLPGGANGGAKILVLELLKQLSKLAPECEFVLLTSDDTHKELSSLDASNVRRVCVLRRSAEPPRGQTPRIGRMLGSSFPGRVALRAFRALSGAGRELRREASGSARVVWDLRGDLLFCPFTEPNFHDPRVPVVSVVHDLQYRDYPQFFTSVQREERDRHFRHACRVASRIICVSEHVRTEVVDAGHVEASRVVAIHNSVQHRVGEPREGVSDAVLGRLGLERGKYLFYPANFWRHKNHEMLLTAFGMYCHDQPDSRLKLVLTGAPGERMEFLRDSCQRMKLGRRVVFAGFVPEEEFAALLRSPLALIFPSLCEGFGMPVWEAMAEGKPVLCSNAAALPEVCGGGALLFDPRKPDEIQAAIRRLEGEPKLVYSLSRESRRRAIEAPSAREMAGRYLAVFRDALRSPNAIHTGFHGLYSDRWTGERALIVFGPGAAERTLELELLVPDWIPVNDVAVQLQPDGGSGGGRRFAPGEVITLHRRLPEEGGFAEIVCGRVFQPKACGAGGDERYLGCRVQTARIVSAEENTDLLERRQDGS